VTDSQFLLRFQESGSIPDFLASIDEGGKNIIPVSTLFGAAKNLSVRLLFEKHKQIIILHSTRQAIQEAFVELHLLGLGVHVVEISDYTMEALQEKLTDVVSRSEFIILATYDLFLTPVPAKQVLVGQTTIVKTGGSLNYSEICEYLELLQYQSQKFVEAPGDYAKRGAIIDFWSYSEKVPTRIEFDGDFIESIRFFDPENQRSIERIEQITLAPPISNFEAVDFSAQNVFDYIGSPLVFMRAAEMRQKNISSDGTETKTVKKVDAYSDDDFDYNIETEEKQEVVEDNAVYFSDIFEEWFASQPGITWIIENELESGQIVPLHLSPAPVINSNYKILYSTISQYLTKGFTVFIAAENQIQADRLTDVLQDERSGLIDLLDGGRIKVFVLPVKDGFVDNESKYMLLTDYQIFNKPYRTKLPSKLKKKSAQKRELPSIKHGDYVVHEEYGIGKYLGLESIMIGEAEQESMKLRYNDGGIVYVNLNYLHLVKKYSAKEGLTPQLSTLGTADWANKKKKAKKRIKEAARELIELYARRKMSKGYSYSPDSIWQRELEASFIYEDTIDQAKVTAEVKADMEASNPMDRLVCGDVGFGKTEIAVRAAFKAVQDGKQVAVLVPTTILAEQHYNTFKDRLSQYPVTIEAMSRFQSSAKQKEIIVALADGKVDIVIGTHRLLSKDVAFKDLGLLIIDEEHRFGVAAKEKLRAYKLNVDILTLTATPIPRTLNLSLLGARDLSIIATPPPNRQPIYTHVEAFESAKLKDWIHNELKRGGQVYIVHDRVQTIERFASYIQKQVPDVKIAVAHGQMKSTQLENVFHGFLHREYNVLLATKIIESGLDIPSTNTIIINRADRFGLAELHQLRGRVGRADRQAYAYLLVPSVNKMNKNTARRLQVIEEYSDLGSGFSLAMRDLEIRGAGNLLGTEQTGFINEIGFDLYIKMINDSVEELKQEEFKDIFKDLPATEVKTETTIEAYFEIGIPKAYISEQMDRLSYYTTLYSIKTIDELFEVEEELKDRFGMLPAIVKRLFMSAELKYLASRVFFERVVIQKKQVLIILPKGNNTEFYETRFVRLAGYIMDHYKDEIRIHQQNGSIKLAIMKQFNVPEKALEYCIGFTKNIAELFGVLPKLNYVDTGSKEDNLL
jgi:transcription-repair coupling factor (superfamily II helicase)